MDGNIAMDAAIFAEPKVDCHMHVLDPARFPYRADTHYAPANQEIGTAAQLEQVLRAYGTQRALLVGPNSGYGLDNRCMLDAIARANGRYKGIAVVPSDIPLASLQELAQQGVVGVAWNVTHYGLDYYADAAPLVDKLGTLGMFVDIQVEHDQLIAIAPLIVDSGVRILVDHCGRPTRDAGIGQRGFQALLELGRTGRAYVKLSGFAKFSNQPAPHEDAWPYITALVEAFGVDHCLWASDWPYLRAPMRVDYGVLLGILPRLFPDRAQRRTLLWETPLQLFGFAP